MIGKSGEELIGKSVEEIYLSNYLFEVLCIDKKVL